MASIAQAKLLSEEQQKFDAAHKLSALSAENASRRLGTEGYSCNIRYVDWPKLSSDGRAILLESRPMLVCSRPSAESNDICAERRVGLIVEWDNPKALRQDIVNQMATSIVVEHAFSCIPKGSGELGSREMER